MLCLQCGNDATNAGTIGEYEIRECANGHRTGQMTKAQAKKSLEKMQVELDAEGNAVMAVKNSRKRSVKKAA